MTAMPLVLVAAGGTGGHLFPAEALAVALKARGARIALATDHRAAHYTSDTFADNIYIVPSATVRGRDPVSLARTLTMLGYGALKAWMLLGRIRPAVVVGFGGYPTVPPVFAATLRGIPTVIQDQNMVLGRANRLLAPRVSAIASSWPDVKLDSALEAKTTYTGNPIRPNVLAAAEKPYAAPDAGGEFRLLVFGGSQGARVMSEIVPPAIERLSAPLRARLVVTQQARGEDLAKVQAAYARAGIKTDVQSFFADLPERIAASHLIVSRSGASTVSELAAIGRPAILVPLPHALDQDQLANAGVLEKAGGAIRIDQPNFTPERLAGEIEGLAADPARLARMAAGAKSVGTLDAAERLADLVLKIAGQR
ncbi:MAG: undecaprenyldiphospho-muramoylpentapeptide beta-N-acetylglucosaminyltransferase [Pseudolabrys sp.]|nr:undecaprenyldiphospho-muramoylpentapeptide beta-N-acetylglucosaminyltransferase [Pseudolabrys sp.]